MYERILLALDGSKAAEMVIPFAEEMAARLGSEITLVMVAVPGEGAQLPGGPYLAGLTEEVKGRLADKVQGKEVKVENKVLKGRPADEILRLADEADFGLIAMTSRGWAGGGPWLLGNIAAKVLRASGKPVLLVRSPAKEAALQQKRLIRRILVPLDGSQLGEAAVPHAETLALALNAELVLLNVLWPVTAWGPYAGYPAYAESLSTPEGRKTQAAQYLESVGKPLKEKGITTSTAVAVGPPSDQIIDYARANAIDLIAMSTHGRSGIGRWVFGSVTDKVLHAGNTAVLVVPAARARAAPERRAGDVGAQAPGERLTKAYMVVGGSGPLVILTSYDSINNPELLKRLHSKGLTKFVAYEVPLALAKERYGAHFNVVCADLHETDDLRVLDYDGERAYRSFSFKELGAPTYHESD